MVFYRHGTTFICLFVFRQFRRTKYIPSHTRNQNIYLICVIKTRSSIGETFFWVYEIADKGTGNVGWVKRDDLGDSVAIFVGNNNFISVSASDFSGC